MVSSFPFSVLPLSLIVCVIISGLVVSCAPVLSCPLYPVIYHRGKADNHAIDNSPVPLCLYYSLSLLKVSLSFFYFLSFAFYLLLSIFPIFGN